MITLALIGVGRWGKNYLSTVDNLDGVEIKYVCAQTPQTLNSLPDKYIKIFSFKDLTKKKIDGIIIATPAKTHFPIARQLLNSGYNLLIEKPLTTNYHQALVLQEIWQKRKPKVLVGHTYLYEPSYKIFKKELEHIKTVKSIIFKGLSSPIRKDVSVVWDWGPHPISLILDLIKKPIIEVSATGSFDTAKVILYFDSGIKAVIYINRQGAKKIRKLIIKGENKTINLDFTKTYDRTAPLKKEISEFVSAIKGVKKITSDIKTGVLVIKVLSAIESSILNNGSTVKLNYSLIN